MALNAKITEFQLYNKTKLILFSSGKIIHKRKNDSLKVSIQELNNFIPCITKVRIYKENSVDQEILRKLKTKDIVNINERLKFNLISLGRYHSLILKNRKVFSFGCNKFGQLRDGTTTNRPSPIKVNRILKEREIISVSAGIYHSLALDSKGNVCAWGKNKYGQLGDGTATDKYSPIQVGGALEGKEIVSVSAGRQHSLALDSDGNIYAWGYNSYGQLGDGTTTDRHSPIQVSEGSILEGKDITSVSAGASYSLALDSDGSVYAWGMNYKGQLGDGTATHRHLPVQISEGSILEGKDIVSVSAGAHHSLVLDSDGKVYAWGSNGSGQLGDGTTTNRRSPIQVGGVLEGKEIVSVSTGNEHSLALDSNGNVYAWGWNADGRLGDGTTTDRHSPIQISEGSILEGKDITSVSAGMNHSLALDSDGKVYAWGWNDYGQLGDGTTTDRHSPTKIDFNLK